MAEVGVDPFDVRFFLETGHNIDLLKPGVREFVEHNLEIAQSGGIEEVAATFFYGREKLIPEMFTSIVEILKREGMECPTLIYYLERHIEVALLEGTALGLYSGRNGGNITGFSWFFSAAVRYSGGLIPSNRCRCQWLFPG